MSSPRTDLPRTTAFAGSVWRGHQRRYLPLDATGSTIAPGRYHALRDTADDTGGPPALYTALDLTVALGEIVRNDPGDRLKAIRFTEIQVELEAVVDCRDLAALGIDERRLFDDWDFSYGQSLARAAREADAEAMLVPSASRLGDNLILFPDRVRAGSTLAVVRTVDPDLTKAPRDDRT